MKFEQRLYAGLMVLAVTLVPLAYLSSNSLVSVNAQGMQLTETYARALVLSKDLLYQQSEEDNRVLSSIRVGDPARESDLTQARRAFLEQTNLVQQLDPSQSTAELLELIRGLKLKLVAETQPVFTLRQTSVTAGESSRRLEMRADPHDVQLRQALQALFTVELARFAKFRDEVTESTRHAEMKLRLSFLVAGIAFLVVVLLLIRSTRSKRALEQDRERLFDKIQQTSLVRKEVLENVAHDLKNPLSAVELSLHLAQRQNTAKETAKTATSMQIAQRSVSTMKDFISMLLDQAKMDAGRFELELQHGCLSELLESVVGILEPLAQQKDIVLSLALDPANTSGRFDRRQMTQVICNILSNAIKFTPRGGLIEIGAAVEGDALRVSIADSGPGIAPDQLENVFTRFWQARTTRGAGTGLGLSIAKTVIEAHGGRIWAENSAATGATFHFCLPRSPDGKRRATMRALQQSGAVECRSFGGASLGMAN